MIYDFGHSKHIRMNNNDLRDYLINHNIFVKYIYTYVGYEKQEHEQI
jgi:hypothetical protein